MSDVAEREPAVAPERELLIELVGLHARALRRMPWMYALLVFGIGLFIVPFVPAPWVLGWGALTVAVELVRARYATAVLRHGYGIDPRRVHARFVALSALSGLAIAAGPVAFLARLPILQQALFCAVMFAIPAAGVTPSQSSRYIIGSYALFILLPTSTTWCFLYPAQTGSIAALTLLYWVVLVLFTADGEKLLRRSVVIRHERDRLVLDLEKKNTQVQMAVRLAEQSAQARARVLAAASHDLRQPLHALSVYSAVLAANPAPDTIRELSRNISQIVHSLGSMLNGLLDLSRLSAGHYVPERRVVQVDDIVASVCAENRQAAESKGLQFEQDLAPIRLLGDPVAIGRIARNLIDNAIKYTDAGKVQVVTRLETRGESSDAVLLVMDTGQGIPASEHERIFEEFYQLDNPGRDRSKGVGLGLAIVQRLCELMGARIGIDSAPGSGTRFEIRIPIVAVESSPQNEPSTAHDAGHLLVAKRVYLVDDEVDILKSMQMLFKTWGAGVWTASTASAAEKLFATQGLPDLLIVDFRLGEPEHGVALAKRLQRDFGRVPVLIVTGETSSDALGQASDGGFPLLQKPIAPDDLLRALREMLPAA